MRQWILFVVSLLGISVAALNFLRPYLQAKYERECPMVERDILHPGGGKGRLAKWERANRWWTWLVVKPVRDYVD